MSIVHSPLPVQQQHSSTRKRTSSFSYPTPALSRPAKALRTAQMGSLRRTETLVHLPETNATSASANPANNTATLPYYRTLQYYKEQRLRRKGLVNRATAEPITIRTRPIDLVPQDGNQQLPQQQQRQPSTAQPPSTHKVTFNTIKRVAPPKAPSQVILPSVASPITITRTHRTSSPLSPARTVLPGRPVFPRSKPEPDLYRVAIKTHMRSSPVGQKILHMGPRLALSIIDATKELERIVADQERERDRDNDVVMSDSTFNLSTSSLASPVLTKSWVFVKNEVHDWEMLDCAA
ncbi:hypothetical protein BYT27DRAFT_7206776 [Phlegmacium glaucopus]|nr:hypothetical protein BYT27DRAFT_7206776 [Phlegmacium glaucopus]